MNAQKTATWILCLVTVLALGGVARAALIQPVGTIQDDSGNEISEWRTATTAKTLDADGDNVYGSDAKLFYRVMGDYGSYVQYITSESQVGPYGGYAVVDHPNDSSANLQVRTTTSGNVGPGVLRNMFTFAIRAAPPAAGFRVGVAFDGLDGAQFSPQQIRLTQTTGGTAIGSVYVEPFRNNTLDMAFFDVTGAAVGNRFTVQGVSGAGGYATHQIVTWDALTTPPPPPPPVQQTWDFETGDLDGWNVLTSGVPGDNLVFTTPGNQPAVQPHSGTFDASTIQGNYWIRTWEGEVLGNSDGHTGIIESDSFVLGQDASFTLLVGGGPHGFSGDPDSPNANMTAVTLERLVGPNDWEMIFAESGGGNALSPRAWDASTFAGDTVRLRIYDTHTGGWGHIDVDNIVYSAAALVPEPASVCLMALGLIGVLGLGWRRRSIRTKDA